MENDKPIDESTVDALELEKFLADIPSSYGFLAIEPDEEGCFVRLVQEQKVRWVFGR